MSSGDRLSGRCLYLCTPDRPDLVAFVAACIDGGVDLVQLRDKDLDARALVARAALVKEVCADHDVPFVLNDRPDLALAAGADGVHVGQDDAPPAVARRILGPEALIGLSTHSLDELEESSDAPVDYLSAGPLEPTPTKPGRAGTGLAYGGLATGRAGRPVFVTGGVRPETVPAMAQAGARRFVVVRFLTQSPDPRADSRLLRSVIEDAVARAAAQGCATATR